MSVYIMVAKNIQHSSFEGVWKLHSMIEVRPESLNPTGTKGESRRAGIFPSIVLPWNTSSGLTYSAMKGVVAQLSHAA